MQVALLTVGDELLAGDTENTNATWLASELTDRGVTVTRVLVVPDEMDAIADNVREYSARYDAVIVTGGLGGTPDDITMAAVATAFDRDLAVDDLALADVEETLAAIAETYPDLNIDPEAEATLPEDARPLLNRAGLSPGCVLGNVYVFPGIPSEMHQMFESVADEFEGDSIAVYRYTEQPEGNLIEPLTNVQMKFEVSVGCYPDRSAGHNRLKVTGDDSEQVDQAVAWLEEHVETTEETLGEDEGDDGDEDD